MNKTHIIFCSFLIYSLLSSDSGASEHDNVRELVLSGKILPLERILKQLKNHHQGQVIEVELEHKKTHFIYEIELLSSDGVVTEYSIDARTGKILKQKVED